MWVYQLLALLYDTRYWKRYNILNLHMLRWIGRHQAQTKNSRRQVSALACFHKKWTRTRWCSIPHKWQILSKDRCLLFGSRQQNGQGPFSQHQFNKSLILFLMRCVYNVIGLSVVLPLPTSSAQHLPSALSDLKSDLEGWPNPPWSILIDCVVAGVLLLLNIPGEDGQWSSVSTLWYWRRRDLIILFSFLSNLFWCVKSAIKLSFSAVDLSGPESINEFDSILNEDSAGILPVHLRFDANVKSNNSMGQSLMRYFRIHGANAYTNSILQHVPAKLPNSSCRNFNMYITPNLPKSCVNQKIR